MRNFIYKLIKKQTMSNRDNGITVLALLTGAAIGAGLGILFAPDKGEKTREKIKESFDGQKNDLMDKFDELSDTVKAKMSQTKLDLEKGFDDLVHHTDDNIEDVIAKLERKLQELKNAAPDSSAKN
jgi:gas vesicle protein